MLFHASDDVSLDPALILDALTRLANGDLTVQFEDSAELGGVVGEIVGVFNRHVRQMNQFAAELTRVSREIGANGRFEKPMQVSGLAGTWKDLEANVNRMPGG